MKIRIIAGAGIIVIGLLLAIGPQTIFTACKGELNDVREAGFKELLSIVEENGIEYVSSTVNEKGIAGLQEETGKTIIFRKISMRCHWGARVLMGIGTMIALLGAALIIFSSLKIKLGLSIGAGLAGIVSLLIPTDILIGVCRSATMHCRMGFSHAVTSLSILLLIGIIINIVYLSRRKEK